MKSLKEKVVTTTEVVEEDDAFVQLTAVAMKMKHIAEEHGCKLVYVPEHQTLFPDRIKELS